MIEAQLKSLLVAQLHQDYHEHKHAYPSEKIIFKGQGQKDVYNISSPFEWQGKTYILGRIESRDSELSDTGFFEQQPDGTYQLTNVILPMLQDPFFTFIDDELLIGGTQIFLNEKKEIDAWHTTVYLASDFSNIRRFMIAPTKMKDVRLFQQDKIYIFTRPQGKKAKLGRIGMETVSEMEDLYRVFLGDAPIFLDQFDDDSWGGVNQVVALKDGRLGILGHIASMSEGDVRHYYAMTFALDPVTKNHTPMKIIAERSDFPEGESKRPDLVDVIFPGGIERRPDGKAILYTGLSDAEAYQLLIDDPFLEYETSIE